ncbi:MAG: hypothetical protein K0B52_05205 [FCB group bacterium]|nr:hypothetical protein [FCB group bacterium]
MKKHTNIAYVFLFCVCLPLTLWAGYASYGNDHLNLLHGPGAELYGSSYGLMQYGSENTMINPARLDADAAKPLYLYHASWFRNEVSASSIAYTFRYKDKPVGVMVSRVGVSAIPDSRNALLDYGVDGIPGTGSAGEGNGILDDNEIIDYGQIVYKAIAHYTVHLGMPLFRKGNFETGVSIGFLYTDLIETKGYGLTFDLTAQHLGKYVHQLYSIKNLPSALMVFNSGVAQYYPPEIQAAWLYSLELNDLQIHTGLAFSMSINENLDYYMFRIGSVLAMDLRPVLRLAYKNTFAAGISYRHGDGVHAGLELTLPLIDISYSFRPSINHDLGSSHLISLRLSTDIFK